ncbi:DUF4167 domain-containing protein [Pelagibacterales bacterium SAG-MED38]|nr:DUF4167 domain-containing protein [Pelagibacterales bacterium SAG-MED38]|tara:strand:- start:149 stop:529 length:381 start_codon:yes stop_codon:yes gene_type:complete
MVTFRNNNNRRSNFRRNDRNFKSNNDRGKFGTNFSNNENFQRKIPGRNNHNASKLIEKYNNLAREALSSGDKILSENYFQHADHFTRILKEQDIKKKNNLSNNEAESSEENIIKVNNEKISFQEKK